MGLIKRQFAEPVLKDAIVLDLGDITRQAEKIREAAERQARKIVEEAHRAAAAEATKGHHDGWEKGHAEGLAKGFEEGREAGRSEALKENNARLNEIDKAWTAAVAEWDAHRDRLDREATHSVLELALRLGEAVVRRTIEVDKQVAVRQVSDALEHVLRPVDVTVRVCADDRALLDDAMPQLTAQFAHLKRIHLKDDPGVSRGGCVISYGQGQIDATIETQLRRLVGVMMPDQTAAGRAVTGDPGDVRSSASTEVDPPVRREGDERSDSDEEGAE